MTEKVEYLYRYRSWDSGCFYGTRDKDSIDVAGAWDEWRFCDENKYNEICDAIRPPYPNHYQAEKMLVTIVESESFDPHEWIENQKAQAEAARQRVNPHATGPGNNGNSFASSSSMSSVETSSILDGIGTIGRVVLDAIADGASSVASGIGDICD
jgi:hypothetical protein